MRKLQSCLACAFAFTAPASGLADSKSPHGISCPPVVAGMLSEQKPGDALCVYKGNNSALQLIPVPANAPSVERYDENLRNELDLASRGNATPFCNKAMTKSNLDAQCIISYNQSTVSLVTELKYDNKRLQARLMMTKDGGINQEHLFWSILATRNLLSDITAN